MEETKLGILVLLASLFCLGTWPALLRLCSVVPSINSSSNSNNNNNKMRNLCHVYMDYATTYFAVSCLPLLLATWLQPSADGNDDDDDDDDDENSEATGALLSLPLILTACIGGSLLSCGNLSMQWATAVHHAPLTTVLSLQASMTVVLGTVLNYVLESGKKTPHPHCLLAGVVVFLLAIGLATRAQVVYAQTKDSLSLLKRHVSLEGVELEPYVYRKPEQQPPHHTVNILDTNSSIMINEATMMSLSNGEQKHEYDTIVPVSENGTILEVDDSERNNHNHHAGSKIVHHKSSSSTTRGVVVAALGGLCFGFFSPCFNIAVNDPFHWTTTPAATTTAEDDTGIAFTVTIGMVNMWFSFAFWLASMVGNTLLLQQQPSISMMERPSVGTVLKDYLLQDGILERRLAVAAGLVCALGNVLQFQGGQMCGYATADLVQAFPLVSTLWDMLLFGEFRNVQLYSTLAVLLLGMYTAYLSGIVLVASSSIP